MSEPPDKPGSAAPAPPREAPRATTTQPLTPVDPSEAEQAGFETTGSFRAGAGGAAGGKGASRTGVPEAARNEPVVSKPASSTSDGSTGASGWVVVDRGVRRGGSGAAEPG